MSSKSKAYKSAEAYLKRWGVTARHAKMDRRDYEMAAVEQCRQGLDPSAFHVFSCSETITLKLGLGRHDLLEEPYETPEKAWERLDGRQRAIVRAAVGEAPWMIGETSY